MTAHIDVDFGSGHRSPQASSTRINVALIRAEANHAATRTAHEFYEAILANEVTIFEAVHVVFQTFAIFAVGHRGRIKSFIFTGGEKHLFNPRQYIIRKLAHLHLIKVMSRWNKGFL